MRTPRQLVYKKIALTFGFFDVFRGIQIAVKKGLKVIAIDRYAF